MRNNIFHNKKNSFLASSPTDKHNSSKSAYGGGHKDDSTQPK